MRAMWLGMLLTAAGLLSGCDEGETAKPKRKPALAASLAPPPVSAPPAAAPATPAQETPAVADVPPESAVPALAAAELPPGIQPDSPEAASLANLKALAAAFNAYHEKHHQYPAAATYDGDTPLLSWRVALLPHLGLDALYKRFDLKQPWDSPTNRPLVAKIPRVYQTPGAPAAGKTCYLVPAGLGTIFSQREGLSAALIADGKDKTVLLVEADPDRAVDWTQPDDLRYFPAIPQAGLGKFRNGCFLMAFAGGAVRSLPSGLNPSLLRALFTASGREEIDLQVLDGPPKAASEANETVAAPAHAQAEAAKMLAKGQLQRGRMLLEADAIRGSDEVLKTYRWSKALQRPLLLVRCGIVVQALGMPAEAPPPAAKTAHGHGHGRAPVIPPAATAMTGAIAYWGGALGKPLLARLQASVRLGNFGAWLNAAADANPANPAGGDKPLAAKISTEGGITGLGVLDAAAARKTALREGIDLLIVAAVSNRKVRVQNNVGDQSTLTLRLFDVARNESLWSSAPINSPVDGNAADAESNVAIAKVLADVMEFIDAEVALRAMPEITAETAGQRAEAVTAAVSESKSDPLPALAEMRYYQVQGKLTPEQLSGFYARILGAEQGPPLATGNDLIRRQILDRLTGLEREL